FRSKNLVLWKLSMVVLFPLATSPTSAKSLSRLTTTSSTCPCLSPPSVTTPSSLVSRGSAAMAPRSILKPTQSLSNLHAVYVLAVTGADRRVIPDGCDRRAGGQVDRKPASSGWRRDSETEQARAERHGATERDGTRAGELYKLLAKDRRRWGISPH